MYYKKQQLLILREDLGSCRLFGGICFAHFFSFLFCVLFVFVLCIAFNIACVSILFKLLLCFNRISGVMVSVLAPSAVDRRFEPRSDQTKDYEIVICCFSAKYAALRSKSKDWLARNQNNVSEWSHMSTRGNKTPTQCVGLEQSDPIIISLKINLFSP